jgi:hypothetical protein
MTKPSEVIVLCVGLLYAGIMFAGVYYLWLNYRRRQ